MKKMILFMLLGVNFVGCAMEHNGLDRKLSKQHFVDSDGMLQEIYFSQKRVKSGESVEAVVQEFMSKWCPVANKKGKQQLRKPIQAKL